MYINERTFCRTLNAGFIVSMKIDVIVLWPWLMALTLTDINLTHHLYEFTVSRPDMNYEQSAKFHWNTKLNTVPQNRE